MTVGSLQRRIGLPDAVALGLGGMIGTGVFVVAGPVAAVAGNAVLGCLLIAAAVAACNATSAARLAARYPVSGGAYHWGRQLLHPLAGSLAGWCFVVGKIASSGAAALTVGLYVDALSGGRWGLAVPAAVLTLVAVTAANISGISRTAAASRVLVAAVIVVLVGVCAAAVAGAPTGADDAGFGWYIGFGPALPGWLAVAVGAGLFFLAFAGYARIATLGEEVRDPSRTIPRAVGLAFAVTVTVYLVVVTTAVRVLGVDRLAVSRTPVADLARESAWPALLVPLVSVAAVAAAAAVALGVQAGISRVLLAMARAGEVPAALARVDSGRGTPWVADIVAGLLSLGVVLTGGVVGAVALSAGTVLVYYAVANAAALRLPAGSPRAVAGRAVAVAGLLGCVLLAAALLAWAWF